jgi:putative FmdB family regulatory protein
MPTYDYQCLKCGLKFEAFQKMSDAPLKECPQCAGRVKRMISSGSGLIFKGSGFYATDYKRSSVSDTKKPVDPSCTKCNQQCQRKNKEQ